MVVGSPTVGPATERKAGHPAHGRMKAAPTEAVEASAAVALANQGVFSRLFALQNRLLHAAAGVCVLEVQTAAAQRHQQEHPAVCVPAALDKF